MSTETATRQTLAPMLTVHDCAGAIDFYKQAFGAIEEGERIPWEGKIGHAEITINGSHIMMADEFAEHNRSPRQLGGTSVMLSITVDDCDKATERAMNAGAEIIREPETQPYGRLSKLRDPYGHVWFLHQR